LKIDQLNIISFGKLKDLNLNFSDKFNFIYGQNEAGKSTMQAFIYSAFFGVKKDKASENFSLRDYYAPWESSSFEGTLIFSLKDFKKYKIFRNFDKAREKLELIDLASGANIIGNFPEGSTRPKESMFADILLGVSREVFKDTIFINQAKTAVLESPEKLSQILQSVASTGIESKSPVNAVDKLDDALAKVGTEKASTKEFFKLNSRIIELGRKKEEIEAKRESLQDLFVKKKEFASEKEKIQDEVTRSSDVIYVASLKKLKDKMLALKQTLGNLDDAKKEAESVKKQISQYEAKRAELKEIFAAVIAPDTGKIKDADELHEIKDEMRELESLNNEKIIVNSRLKDADSKTGAYKDKAKNILNFAAIAVVILAVSVISYFIFKSKFVFYFSFIAAAANIGLGVYVVMNILELKKNTENLKMLSEEAENVNIKERGLNEKINSYFRSMGVKDYEELRMRLEDINRADEAIKTKYEIKESIEKRLRGENEHYYQQVNDINGYIDKMRLKDVVLGEDIDGSVNFLENKIIKESERLNLNPDKFSEEEEFVRNKVIARLNYIEKELSHIEGVEKQAMADLEDISEVEEDLEEVEERRKEVVLYIKALNEAKNTIVEISEDYHREFAPELTSYAAGIISRITNKYKNVFLDKDFNVRVEISDNIGVKNVENLSLGAREQFYFALKTALGRYLSLKGEMLPLILDDVLTNFDEERRSRTFEFMLDLSADTQIIIFTSDINQYNQVKGILNSRGTAFNEETKGEFNLLKL